MLGDGAVEDILLHQRDVIRIKWHQFQHETGRVPEDSTTMEGLAYQVSSNTFIFLGDFHMNCFDELAFGLGEGIGRVGCRVGRGAGT